MKEFYVSNLPGCPFDYWWEIHPHFEERVTRNYIGRSANLEPVPEELSYQTVRIKGEWELRMMHEDETRIEKSVIYSLDDDTLRVTAAKMANAYMLRNRVATLEEEPVRLMRDDDLS